MPMMMQVERPRCALATTRQVVCPSPHSGVPPPLPLQVEPELSTPQKRGATPARAELRGQVLQPLPSPPVAAHLPAFLTDLQLPH